MIAVMMGYTPQGEASWLRLVQTYIVMWAGFVYVFCCFVSCRMKKRRGYKNIDSSEFCRQSADVFQVQVAIVTLRDLTVGSGTCGTCGAGGSMLLTAGRSMSSTGGVVVLASGEGTATSGAVISTAARVASLELWPKEGSLLILNPERAQIHGDGENPTGATAQESQGTKRSKMR